MQREFSPVPLIEILDQMDRLAGREGDEARAAWLRSLRPSLQLVRDAYSKGSPVDYTKQPIRDLYMLAYFPAYAAMVYHMMKSVPVDHLDAINTSVLRCSCLGCGPAPEALGILAFAAARLPQVEKMEFWLLDKFVVSWRHELDICMKCIAPRYWHEAPIEKRRPCDILVDCGCCDEHPTCKKVLAKTRIVIVQNVLSEAADRPDEAVRKLHTILRYAAPRALLLLLDVHSAAEKVLLDFEESCRQLQTANILLSATEGWRDLRGPIRYPRIVRENLFSQEDRQRPKARVNYYRTLVMKL